jgi:hypothetical protein
MKIKDYLIWLWRTIINGVKRMGEMFHGTKKGRNY